MSQRIVMNALATSTGKKLKKDFMKLQSALPRGDWNGALSLYKKMLSSTNGEPSFILRSYLLNGFGSILTDQCRGRATREDVELLKSIAEGTLKLLLVIL